MKKYHLTYILFLALILILSQSACNKQNGGKVYSFFFDSETGSSNDSAGISGNSTNKTVRKDTIEKNKVTVYVHPPYKDMACDNCHQKAGSIKLIAKIPELCYNCHLDFNEKFKVLHGPLGIGSCTECHNPHQSQYEKLLIRKGQELCYYCHSKTDVEKIELHREIGEQKCWDCHDPHGGSEKPFIK